MRNREILFVTSLMLAGCSDAGSASEEVDTDAAAVTLAADNLFANPSFETNTAGWGGWQGSILRVRRSGAPNGSYVAKVVRQAGTSYSIDDALPTVPNVPAGSEYTASVYVRAASLSAVGKPVQLAIREWAAAAEVQRYRSSPVALTYGWQELVVRGAVPGAGHSLDVFVYQDSAASGDAFFADAFEMRRTPVGSPVPDPADGGVAATDSGSATPPVDGGAPTTLVNRPTQPAALIYGGNDQLGAAYAHPGAIVAAGRGNYANQVFKSISAAGGTVLIYLDALIDNAEGRYAAMLIQASECGAAVPRWPGSPKANEWGYLNDFRPGGILQQKLECVLEKMVAENPHMGGWFADDLGSRSWYPGFSWSGWPTSYQQAYRDGAIELTKTFRRVADRHGLIFIVNGTWGAGSLSNNGGGYPDMSQHGNALADGAFIENHSASELGYWGPYSTSAQWASQSSITHGTAFVWTVNPTASDRDAFARAGVVAFASAQSDYGVPETPWSGFHPTGLPSHVR